jgi:uncharacterized membrane protein YciS (DUF1049 family)
MPALLTVRQGGQGVPDSVITTVAILLFIGIDIGAVVIALLWLSERRVENDKTDQRNRHRPIRYK